MILLRWFHTTRARKTTTLLRSILLIFLAKWVCAGIESTDLRRAAVAAVAAVFPSSSSRVASPSSSPSSASSSAATSVVSTTTTTTTTSSVEDRVLFWSSYDFNIDAATQLMGPLDMILRGGSSSMSAAECSLEQDAELDDNSFNTMSDNVSLTSTDVDDEEEDEIASSLKQASSNRTSRMAQSLMTAVRGGGGGVTHSKLKYTLFQKGDGSEKDPDGIPTRYLLMHPGNREMAKKSLQATIEWRKVHAIDDLLNRAQPKFDICKAVFPHYFLGRDKNGHVVFVQHPARLNLEKARANNLKNEELLMHYVFVNEYLWQVVEKENALATMTSIIDLQGLHLGVLRQMDIINFVKVFVSTMDSFYPQRANKTLLLNAPKWFNAIYKLLSPLMRETTKARIEIHTRGKAQDESLKKTLGDEAIRWVPKSFWSSWKQPPTKQRRRNKVADDNDDDDDDDSLEELTIPESKMEKDLKAFVMSRNKAEGKQMLIPV